MAKKKVSKKKSTKKTGTRKASGGSTGAAKKTAKKTTKKVTKKVTKKKVVKKPVAKKTTKKAASKATTKKVSKKTTKKSVKKSATSKKATTKASSASGSKKIAKKTAKKVAKKTTKKTAKKTAGKASSAGSSKASDKSAKASTESKPADTKSGANASKTTKKKRSSKSKKPALVMPTRPLLLGPNGPALKPLIPSGKDNQQAASVLDNVTSRRTKTPLTKTQLDKYRMILLQRRAEMLGDVRTLEDEALRSDSGRSSHNTKNSDDAGSESYEQSLSLNLAAAERERIYEIDAALERIKERTYGLCEMTFEPISKARLDEIPWARYTIAAARELDRRSGSR